MTPKQELETILRLVQDGLKGWNIPSGGYTFIVAKGKVISLLHRDGNMTVFVKRGEEK